MSDAFSRTIEYGDSFAADRMVISFSGFGAGLLTQALNTNYTQQINRVWELGSNKTFYLGGRVAGTFGMANIAGPGSASREFLKTYGDICSAAQNTLRVSWNGGWCSQGTGGGQTLHNVVIQNIATQINVNNMMVNESTQGMFAWLDKA